MNRPLAAMLLLWTLLAGGMLLVAACDTTTLNPAPGPPAGRGGPPPVPTPTQTLAARGFGNLGSVGDTTARNLGGGIPANAEKPAPPPNSYQGCPAQGDGGDPQLNMRKNRVDSAPWYPVAIQNLLALPWPKSIERKQRQNWSAEDAAAVARYEGIPVQVEGWLAGAKQQGPESCNCHSPDDVDNHLWIVDAPSKDRAHSLVIEITPRVRALHPGWALGRIRPLVDGKTKVRISGWLMMDQEHPDQVGQTRGNIWEIHPIIGFDVQKGNQWVSLDTGRVVTTNPIADAEPTEDPSLPPPIEETPAPNTPPTPTPRPTERGGSGQTQGVVEISKIVYDGQKGSSEPDEYIEITNRGSDPVDLGGWVLRDVYGGQEFTWDQFTLAGKQKIRIYTNEVHRDSGGFSFDSNAAIWANKGDAAELVNAQGAVVSTFAYGNKR